MDEDDDRLAGDKNDIALKELIDELGPPDADRISREALRHASPELARLEQWERDSLANAGKIFIGAGEPCSLLDALVPRISPFPEVPTDRGTEGVE